MSSRERIDVIMPMLGEGSRMRGIQNTIKPLMRFSDGKVFFIKALDSLRNYEIDNLVLVVREEYLEQYEDIRTQVFLSTGCHNLDIYPYHATGSHYESFCVGFRRLQQIKSCQTFFFDSRLVVLDCDIYSRLPVVGHRDSSSILFVFEDRGDEANKCYVKTDSLKNVIEIAEKRRISDMAVFGAYLFSDLNTLDYIVSEFEFLKNMSDILKIFLISGRNIKTKRIREVELYGTREEFLAIEKV